MTARPSSTVSRRCRTDRHKALRSTGAPIYGAGQNFMIRKTLDGLYTLAGVLAALCLIAILFLIVIQMLARWTGEVFPGAPD